MQAIIILLPEKSIRFVKFLTSCFLELHFLGVKVRDSGKHVFYKMSPCESVSVYMYEIEILRELYLKNLCTEFIKNVYSTSPLYKFMLFTFLCKLLDTWHRYAAFFALYAIIQYPEIIHEYSSNFGFI